MELEILKVKKREAAAAALVQESELLEEANQSKQKKHPQCCEINSDDRSVFMQ